MIAATAVIWILLDAEANTPPADLGRNWTFAGVADASFQPLFTYPDYQNGARVVGGFQFARPVAGGLRFVWSGRAGGTYVDDWRTVFESSAAIAWPNARVEVDAGLRHDNRLSRDDGRSNFRDPTGRVFVSSRAFPFQKGWFAVGASVEYQRGMPGELRLPSSASASLLVRIRQPRRH